jgi:F-box interacting protein
VLSQGRTGGWPTGSKERVGRGFLFDEQWRFTARFTVDPSARLIGTCNSLLFFLLLNDAIKVVEPFAGESIIVPLPPTASPGDISTSAYGLGFDSRTRQYKIVHGLYRYSSSKIETVDQDLYVFTVGADTKWRTVRIACALHGVSSEEPASGDGAVYWLGRAPDGVLRYARFDLTTEEITSVDHRMVAGWRMPVEAFACKYHGRGLACATSESCGSVSTRTPAGRTTSRGRRMLGRRRMLPKGHPLQRGHLLLQERDGELYAREIESSSTCKTELYLGWEKLLVGTGQIEEESNDNEWYKFHPIHSRHHGQRNESGCGEVDVRPIVESYTYQDLTTFAYGPTLHLP